MLLISTEEKDSGREVLAEESGCEALAEEEGFCCEPRA